MDIAKMRQLVEPHALRLSAPRLSADELASAEDTLRPAAAAVDPVERAQLHWRKDVEAAARMVAAQIGDASARVREVLRSPDDADAEHE